MGTENNEIAFLQTILFEIKSVIFLKINGKILIFRHKNDDMKEKKQDNAGK